MPPLTARQEAALSDIAHDRVTTHPGTPHYTSAGPATWTPPDITALVADGYARDCADGYVHLTRAGQREVTGR